MYVASCQVQRCTVVPRTSKASVVQPHLPEQALGKQTRVGKRYYCHLTKLAGTSRHGWFLRRKRCVAICSVVPLARKKRPYRIRSRSGSQADFGFIFTSDDSEKLGEERGPWIEWVLGGSCHHLHPSCQLPHHHSCNPSRSLRLTTR